MKIFGLNISKSNTVQKTAAISTPDNMPCYLLQDAGIDNIIGRAAPYSCENLYTLYKNISEIQYPLNFIVNRVKNVQIVVKKISSDSKEDSIEWNNKRLNQLLEKINPYYSFKDYIANSILMRLLDGNSFCYAACDPAFSKSFYKYCDNFFVLPSQYVEINKINSTIDIFSAKPIKEIIKDYTLTFGGNWVKYNIDNILHIRDSFNFNNSDLRADSRLISQKYSIGNLMAVYEARNVIYTKRGALGAIVSEIGDATGKVVMSETEKNAVHESFNKYGLSYGKKQYIISPVPVKFIQMGATIKDLEPFRETFIDAANIAGIFGINKDLLPREENSTFDNQKTIEANIYPSVIFPLVQSELDYQSKFMGLTNDGYYFDAVWDKIPILEESNQKKQEWKKTISQRCQIDFNAGLITLNDWRSQIGLENIKEALYDKTLLEMTDEENAKLKNLIISNGKSITVS